MNPPVREEIECRLTLPLRMAMGILMPSKSMLVFYALMFVIWYALVPIPTIAFLVLAGVIATAGLQLTIVVLGIVVWRWRVQINGTSVAFFQGRSLVATCQITPYETKAISVTDSDYGWEELQIARSDGSTLQVLQAVSAVDLKRVADRL